MEKKRERRGLLDRSSKYILAILFGMMIVVLCLALTDYYSGRIEIRKTTAPVTDETENTESEKTEDAESSVSVTTSTTTKAATATKESTTRGTLDPNVATVTLDDGMMVIPSRYQDVPGYDWHVMYVLLADLTLTNGLSKEAEPVFFLFSVEGYDTPLILLGHIRDSGETTEFYLYTMDGERLYQLSSFTNQPMYSPSLKSLVFENECAAYRFVPHVLVRQKLDSLPDDLSPVAMVSLQDNMVTSESIETFLVDLSGEEAAE